MNKKQKFFIGLGIILIWLSYVAFLFLSGGKIGRDDLAIWFICVFVIVILSGFLIAVFDVKR